MGSTTPSAQAHSAQPQRIFFGPFDVTNQVFLTTPHSFALVNLKPLLPGHVLVCPLRRHQRLTDLSPAEVTDLFTAVQRVQRMLARHYFFPPTPSAPAIELDPPPHTSKPNPTNNTQSPGTDTESTGKTGEKKEKEGDPYAGAFNIALQDGPLAGQTVPHVHVHIIPRIAGSTGKPPSTPSDAVYDQMAGEEGNVGGALWDRDIGEIMRERPQPGGGFPRIEDCQREARGDGEMEKEAGVYRGVLEAMDAEEGGV